MTVDHQGVGPWTMVVCGSCVAWHLPTLAFYDNESVRMFFSIVSIVFLISCHVIFVYIYVFFHWLYLFYAFYLIAVRLMPYYGRLRRGLVFFLLFGFEPADYDMSVRIQ